MTVILWLWITSAIKSQDNASVDNIPTVEFVTNAKLVSGIFQTVSVANATVTRTHAIPKQEFVFLAAMPLTETIATDV